MPSAMERIGTSIRRRRREKKLSAQRVADAVAVSAMTISRIEQGQNTEMDTLIKVADALDLELALTFRGA